MQQEKPKVYTTSKVVEIIEGEKGIDVHISAYPNCVLIVVNQTESIGSIVSGCSFR